MSERKKSKDGLDIPLNFGGLSDIFNGVNNLIDLVDRMDKEGRTEFTRSKEIKDIKDKGIKGVFGVSVKLGLGGMPEVERFGNIRQSSDGPVVEDTREPITDVFLEKDHLLVVAELPGADDGEITVELKDDILVINAASKAVPGRKYTKEVLLDVPVLTESLTRQYKNGILEVKLLRIKKDQENH